jgi:hypothetical protein
MRYSNRSIVTFSLKDLDQCKNQQWKISCSY